MKPQSYVSVPNSPPGEAASSAPLTVDRDNGDLVFEWGIPDPGCLADNYAVYRGDLTQGYESLAPEPGFCAVAATSATLPLGPGAADFFLVSMALSTSLKISARSRP